MDILPVKKLEPGDTIGLFSSSSPTSERSVNNIKKYFESKGYKIKTSSHLFASNGYMAGTAKERADDLNELVNDNDVKIIMTANGGKSGLQMLPFIDYEAVRKHSKGIIGLSDPAVLLNAVTAKSGIISLHGPNGYNFGENSLSEYSEKNWWDFVTGKQNNIYLGEEAYVLRGKGDITGTLFGGHLGTVSNLLGTEWEPEWRASILFLEEAFTNYSSIDAMLNHLRYCGVFDKINGLIFGKLEQCGESNYEISESLQDIILRNCDGYDFPIVTDAWIGHTENKVTLPIGGSAELSLNDCCLNIIDKVVI